MSETPSDQPATSFRDALAENPMQQAVARSIVRSWYGMAGGDPAELADAEIDPNTGDLQLAYDILASPEMQAIRTALGWWAGYERSTSDRTYRSNAELMRERHLPASVIDWVLGA